MSNENYICPKCGTDVSVDPEEETGRCETCGIAFKVCRDADFVNGMWQDRTVLQIVMRSQVNDEERK